MDPHFRGERRKTMGRVPTPPWSYGKKLKKTKQQYTCSKFASHFDVLEKKKETRFSAE